ncbi:MAG: histidine kinase [Candidatus Eisenbacteria bacterium]|nr:histidine kinase [Candidatus Eisenbacteria bacterium]
MTERNGTVQTTIGPSRTRVAVAAWLAFAAFYAMQSYAFRLTMGQSIVWSSFLWGEALFVGLLALQTPFTLGLASRFPLTGSRAIRNRWLHVGFAICFGMVHRFTFEVVARAIRASEETPFDLTRAWQSTVATFESGVFVYFIVLVAAHLHDYYRRYHEETVRATQLRADLSSAQLETLRMQVQPHFLFNTLNAVSVLVEEDPAAARGMISNLSEFLRSSLIDGADQEIPLSRELRLLERYLDIEQVRFGDRLTVQFDVDEDVRDVPVPALILQPIAENAIRHGLSRRPGAGRIEVAATRTGGAVELAIRDLGKPPEPTEPTVGTTGATPPQAAPSGPGLGIGLANTRARLEQLYGSDQKLTMTSIERDGLIGSEVRIWMKARGE